MCQTRESEQHLQLFAFPLKQCSRPTEYETLKSSKTKCAENRYQPLIRQLFRTALCIPLTSIEWPLALLLVTTG